MPIYSTIASTTSNKCQQLTGLWYGTYADHGPYGIIMPLNWALQLKSQTGKFIGTSIQPKSEIVTLRQFTIVGKCDPNSGTLSFHLLNPRVLCGPSSIAKLSKEKGKWQISSQQMQWENAMTGGQGPLIMRKLNSKVIKIPNNSTLARRKLKFPSCH